MRLLWKAAMVVGALCGTIWAQTSLTSVRGTVTDPSGAVVPGAQVVFTNQASGQKQAQVAGGQAEYQFPQLVPGTYLLTASATGSGTQSKRANFSLANPQPSIFNFSLRYAF